ncbi:MAG: glucuronate isomerase [Candidatus Enteromonas sp.]|nr:glucuronate isomerase [Candidatus Enteromonas sp.]
MKQFLGDDFLLNSPLAVRLYNDHASKMPIFDFHCHLIPQQIYEDHRFETITEVWLGGDHYKWRLLREMGVDESYITGDKTPWEKFQKYAECMPYFIGNPIYEWTHLELKTFFGISTPLSANTAREIYEECNRQLQTLTARKMMEKCHVSAVYTTDDPLDSLEYHALMRKDPTLHVQVAPCWRPDKAINIERPSFLPWRNQLETVVGRKLPTLQDFLKALDERLAFFVENGCVASDHGLDAFRYKKATYEEADAVYQKGVKGERISVEDEDVYKGYLLVHLGREYHRYGMVQQYHIGALRDNSKRNFALLGPDSGFDAVSDAPYSEKLSGLLNELDQDGCLPKTVLYCLNEKDYIVLCTLMNCFQGGERGKIQVGTAWWFNDHYEGMLAQFKKLSMDGLLSCFIGMLTDSRSFLSYPRHDYFRRELCSYIASLVEEGRYPNDEETLGKIVEDICFHNAKAYFTRK